MTRHRLATAALVMVCSIVPACSEAPDPVGATQTFADCLERNGIESEGLELTLNPDGTVGSISVRIVSEGDVPYEPVVRLGCTQEVEAGT